MEAAVSPDNPAVGKAAPNRGNLDKVVRSRGNLDKVVRSRGNLDKVEALNPVGPALQIPSPAFPGARHPRPALPAPVAAVYPSNLLAWRLLRREPAVLGLLLNIDLLPPKTQPTRPNWRNGDTACAAPRRGPLP